MNQLPKSLYAIANRYWLESTSYNPHYKYIDVRNR